jgi:hypothetical protein
MFALVYTGFTILCLRHRIDNPMLELQILSSCFHLVNCLSTVLFLRKQQKSLRRGWRAIRHGGLWAPSMFSCSVTQFNVCLAFRVWENFRDGARSTINKIQAQSSFRHPIDFDDFSVRSREFVLPQSVAHAAHVGPGTPIVNP